MRPLMIATALLVMAGCSSHAGPFITHISPAGPGSIMVQKCMVEYSKFNNEISTSDCTTRTLRITTGEASPWSAPPKGWSANPDGQTPPPAPASPSPEPATAPTQPAPQPQ